MGILTLQTQKVRRMHMSSKVISNGKKHISLFGKEMKKNGALYMMFLPAAVFLILFNYLHWEGW